MVQKLIRELIGQMASVHHTAFHTTSHWLPNADKDEAKLSAQGDSLVENTWIINPKAGNSTVLSTIQC